MFFNFIDLDIHFVPGEVELRHLPDYQVVAEGTETLSADHLVVVLSSLVLIEIYRIRKINCSLIHLDPGLDFQLPGRLARTLNVNLNERPRGKLIIKIIVNPNVWPGRTDAVN